MPRQRSRRAATVATLVATVLLATPAIASADTTSPGSYHAKADATALALSVLGQGVTLGVTHAENASDPHAAASALGRLVPGLDNEVAKVASANNDTTSDDQPETCGPISLPPEIPVVDLVTACSAVSALVADGFPGSVGDAAVSKIDVNGSVLLNQLGSQVNQPIGDLITGLQPILDAIKDGTGVDSKSLLDDLISAITKDGNLVRITLGPSKSTSGADLLTETATASAKGAVIELLPRDLLDLAPVLTITVGAASNTITIDRTTGQATVAFLPSIVTATIADDIAAALQLPDSAKTISVAPGQSQCLGLPAPLDSCITVAGGTQSTDEQGVTHANASGVSLHLLTGVQDGIRLDLAATSVEGVGALETSREAPPDLARTGGVVDTMLGGSLFAVAIGGMVLVRRSRRDLV